MTGNSNRCASVGNTGREVRDVTGLVLAGQSQVIVFTVDGNVFHVSLAHLLDSVLDRLHTLAGCSGELGGEVGVQAGTVPVTAGQGLGVERGLRRGVSERFRAHNGAPCAYSDSPFFTYPQQQESGHPEVVTHLDTGTRADLELPLGRHDLGVDTGDHDTGVETSPVVRLDEITGVHLAGTDTTVVRTLGSGEPLLGPSVRVSIGIEQGVFLLETEPGFLVGDQVHGLLGEMTLVGGVRGTVVVVTFTQDQDVLAASEGILEDGGGSEEDVRVVAGGLGGGGTVKVPFLEVGNGLGLFVESHGLASHTVGTVDPDV